METPAQRADEMLEILAECDGNTWAVAEAFVDRDVSQGEYEGCSTELEMAFQGYQEEAEAVLREAGG